MRIILLVAVGLMALSAGCNVDSRIDQSHINPSPIASSPKASTQPLNTQAWKQCIDSKAGFQFDYPADMQLHVPAEGDFVKAECSEIGDFFHLGYDLDASPLDPIEVSITPSSGIGSPRTLSDYLAENPMILESLASLVFDHVDAYDSLWGTDKAGYEYVFVVHEGDVIEVSADKRYSDLLHAIVMTIKFN